jgi:hypothetical protein
MLQVLLILDFVDVLSNNTMAIVNSFGNDSLYIYFVNIFPQNISCTQILLL